MSEPLERAVRYALDLIEEGIARREAVEEAARELGPSEAEIARRLCGEAARRLVAAARREGLDSPDLAWRTRAATALGVSAAALARAIDRELGERPAENRLALDKRLKRAAREAATREAAGTPRATALKEAADRWGVSQELVRARLFGGPRRRHREGLGARAVARGFLCRECGDALVRCKGRYGAYYMCPAGHRARTERTPTDRPCPACARPLDIVAAPAGAFLGCSAYPECTARRPLPASMRERAGVDCPRCAAPMVVTSGPSGAFLACSSEACPKTMPLPGEGPYRDNARAPIDCAACGAPMVVVDGERGEYFACARYPWCRSRAGSPGRLLCPECGGMADLVVTRSAAVIVCRAGVRCPDDARRMRRSRGKRHRVYRCSEPGCGRRVTLGTRVPQASAIEHFFAAHYDARSGAVGPVARLEYRNTCGDCLAGRVVLEAHVEEYFWSCQNKACLARMLARAESCAPAWACPECRAATSLREGRYGAFVGCTRFPDCRATLPAPGAKAAHAT